MKNMRMAQIWYKGDFVRDILKINGRLMIVRSDTLEKTVLQVIMNFIVKEEIDNITGYMSDVLMETFQDQTDGEIISAEWEMRLKIMRIDYPKMFLLEAIHLDPLSWPFLHHKMDYHQMQLILEYLSKNFFSARGETKAINQEKSDDESPEED